jgi:hypothetical protein
LAFVEASGTKALIGFGITALLIYINVSQISAKSDDPNNITYVKIKKQEFVSLLNENNYKKLLGRLITNDCSTYKKVIKFDEYLKEEPYCEKGVLNAK